MPYSRKSIITLGEPAVFHCVSRCVRRAWLCGRDPLTKKCFEHRRFVIYELIKEYAAIFAVEVFACSVLNNHYHLVIRVDPLVVEGWSDEEVIKRWDQVYSVKKLFTGIYGELDDEVINKALEMPELIQEWRTRLCSISWFMKQINEPVARMANKEDGCKGRFWEGRFKCQRLEDEGAVLACMAYVDLNPVRADMARTPEESDYTSAQDRIVSLQARCRSDSLIHTQDGSSDKREEDLVKELLQRDKWLTPVEAIRAGTSTQSWFFSLEEYLKLLDETGRIIKDGKSGSIPQNLAPLLDRVNLDQGSWILAMKQFGKRFYRIAGQAQKMLNAARSIGQKWVQGLSFSRAIYQAC